MLASLLQTVAFAALARTARAQDYGSGSSTSSSSAGGTSGAGASGASAEGGGSGGGGGGGESSEETTNAELVQILLYIWVGVAGVVAAYRLTFFVATYIRKLACFGSDTQLFFGRSTSAYALFQKHVLDAPLFGKRHTRALTVGRSITLGSLPSRLQTIVVLGYTIINVVFLSSQLDTSAGTSAVAQQVRLRAGWLSTFNLLLLVVLAGRNNPLIRLLDIPFDSMNLFHRWLGRIAVAEAAVHGFIYIQSSAAEEGLAAFFSSLAQNTTNLTGTVALFAFMGLISHSPSPLRKAYYELFLTLHILLAITVFVGLWYHYSTTKMYIVPVIGIWVSDRVIRLFTLLRRNVGGAGGTMAEVEALPGDAVRVTLHMARPWTFRPGQHLFLYIPKIGLWTNHPFSVAWSDDGAIDYSDAKTDLSTLPLRNGSSRTTMSLVIRRRAGFTDKLFAAAQRAPSNRLVARAFVEGPYGGGDLDSYGTVLLFAAGVGITHQLPFVRALVGGFARRTSAARRVTLVWVVQAPEHLEWVRPWMTELMGMQGRRDVLRIMVFVTRPRSSDIVSSPSASVQMLPGKPDVDALVAQQQATQVGTMAVTVCGTGSLGDDVRASVRKRCQTTAIEFVENAFTW